jgi:hypothetical protein
MMKNTDKEMEQMSHYGITSEQKPLYRYKQYQYGKLQDAIDFAKIEEDQSKENFISGEKSNTPLTPNEKYKPSTLE